MDIVLRNNLILITTSFETLNREWMREFLQHHSRGMLFLSKSVLVFRNETLKEVRDEFLKELSQHHASTHEYDYRFFLRSMLKFGSQPIKIELKRAEKTQKVKVNLYAYDKDTVLITLDSPNSWVLSYFRSQLEVYVERGTDLSLVVDVSDHKAKDRLERTLNKKDVLHYHLEYSYDNHFLSKLYSDFASYSFGDLCNEAQQHNLAQLYKLLECPVGSSQDIIKRNYKKLARAYHPDRIIHQDPNMVEHYTEKFQLLQEAYIALKEVS